MPALFFQLFLTKTSPSSPTPHSTGQQILRVLSSEPPHLLPPLLLPCCTQTPTSLVGAPDSFFCLPLVLLCQCSKVMQLQLHQILSFLCLKPSFQRLSTSCGVKPKYNGFKALKNCPLETFPFYTTCPAVSSNSVHCGHRAFACVTSFALGCYSPKYMHESLPAEFSSNI